VQRSPLAISSAFFSISLHSSLSFIFLRTNFKSSFIPDLSLFVLQYSEFLDGQCMLMAASAISSRRKLKSQRETLPSEWCKEFALLLVLGLELLVIDLELHIHKSFANQQQSAEVIGQDLPKRGMLPLLHS
jgi:hypothetical protein